MNVDLGIWARLTRTMLFLVIVAALVGVGLWYLPLIRQNEAMRKEILRLDAQIQFENAKKKRLEAAIIALKSDKEAVERLARQTLGYARPGETVFLFEPPGAGAGIPSLDLR